MSTAWRLAAVATFALLALQWAWPLGWPGSTHDLAWSIALSLPLLPPAVAFLRRRPRAPLWAGIVALFYFCGGVTEVRARGGIWGWGWIWIALSLLIVFAAGWPGIAAKIAKRRAASPPNV